MKYLIPLLLLPQLTFSQNSFFERVNQFLIDQVSDGKVDYQLLKNSPEVLDQLVVSISDFYLENQSQDYLTAFYINTYNLLVIKQVVDNYPINSPKDIIGFFDENSFTVAGEQLTLDQIEFDKIITPTKDPRVHFALGCAAQSCPFLYDQAYTPDNLQQQLEFRAQLIIDQQNFVKVNKGKRQIIVNKIFDWYNDQFIKEDNTLIEYINNYRFYNVPEGYEVVFMEYNWALNDIK